MARGGAGLSSEERLRKRREFLAVYASGERLSGRYFFLYVLKNELPVRRLGLTVSMKVGRPVARNRVKRRLREVFRRHKKAFTTSCDVVVNVRRSAVAADFKSLECEFLRIAAGWSGR